MNSLLQNDGNGDEQSRQTSGSSVSGRRLVVLMFLFGIAATVAMWVYWTLHLTPFMPFQKSLAAEFKNSSPRVSGGQRKISDNSPRILRVVMRVPFDPTSGDSSAQEEIDGTLRRIRDLAGQHVNLPEYEILEVHLFLEVQHPASNEIRSQVFRKNVTSWQDVNEDGSPHVSQQSGSDAAQPGSAALVPAG
ncbi:MAG: hypothetical protein R3C19_22190 [Planctomycetaceae bacterium]